MNPTVKKYPRIQKGPKFFRRKCSVAKRSSLKSDPVIHLSKNLSLQSSHLSSHTSYTTPDTSISFLTPHSSLLTFYASFSFISHTSALTPHLRTTLLAFRASDFQTSHLKPQMSYLTYHNPHLTPHASPLSSRIPDVLHPLSDREFCPLRVAW